MLTGETVVLGLLGWPVRHSVSPAMQNAALAGLGLDYVYVPYAVAPQNLEQAVRGLAALGVAGANVTIPHKEAVIPFLKRLSGEAQLIGAVNTLVWEDNGWMGHNTDGAGFVRAMQEELGLSLEGASFLFLGAGGAVRAAAFAVAAAGAGKIVIANRNLDRARNLCSALAGCCSCAVEAVPLGRDTVRAAVAAADVLVNALPLGMYPEVEAMPPVDMDCLRPPLVVCDLIYNPRPTRFLAAAMANGCRTMDGLSMLVFQGALSLELWTGRRPTPDVMRSAAEAALAWMGQAGRQQR